MSEDEGPSDRDVERFSGVTVSCPSCRTEMYDDAQVCWKCGHTILGERKGAPVWAVVTAVVLIVCVAGVLAWVL